MLSARPLCCWRAASCLYFDLFILLVIFQLAPVEPVDPFSDYYLYYYYYYYDSVWGKKYKSHLMLMFLILRGPGGLAGAAGHMVSSPRGANFS